MEFVVVAFRLQGVKSGDGAVFSFSAFNNIAITVGATVFFIFSHQLFFICIHGTGLNVLVMDLFSTSLHLCLRYRVKRPCVRLKTLSFSTQSVSSFQSTSSNINLIFSGASLQFQLGINKPIVLLNISSRHWIYFPSLATREFLIDCLEFAQQYRAETSFVS